MHLYQEIILNYHVVISLITQPLFNEIIQSKQYQKYNKFPLKNMK